MNSHQKKIGSYYLLKPIGIGSFAKVYKGLDERTNEIVAIKMINKLQFPLEKNDLIDKEISILKSLSHPNIIRIQDIKRTQNNIYLIFEFCHLGDLESYIKKCYFNPETKKATVPENVAQKIIMQLSEAFKLMYEKNIVHRDLKLANILVTKDFIIKLADFGFAKYVENNLLLQSYCGTPITMAPEILKRRHYNQKCDIWSLGIIIYRMLFGDYPFFPSAGGNLDDLIELIHTKDLNFPSDIQVSEEVKNLMRGMLMTDPNKRMGFDEFFENPWVKGSQNLNKIVLNDNELQAALKSVYFEKSPKNQLQFIDNPRKNSELFQENQVSQKKTGKSQIISDEKNYFTENPNPSQEKYNISRKENEKEIENSKDNRKNSNENKLEENQMEPENREEKDSRLSFIHLKIRNLLRMRIYELIKEINDSKQISDYFLGKGQNKSAFLILLFILNKIKAILAQKIDLILPNDTLSYQFNEIFGVISKELKKLFKEFYNKTEQIYKELDVLENEQFEWSQLIFNNFLELCRFYL